MPEPSKFQFSCNFVKGGTEMRTLVVLALWPLLWYGNGLQFNSRNEDHASSSRQARVFSLFNVVSFRNAACTSTMAGSNNTARTGTCYTSSECSSRSGRSSGSCASGFGVCCVFLANAGSSTIRENCTYIQNPGFPSALNGTNSLSYTVNKCSDGVCSLRLDFENFSIRGPADTTETATGGACQDSFTVTSTSIPTGSQIIPIICGSNTGQHIFVDVGAANSDTATLAFSFAGASTTRMFDIKVTQIPCGSAAAARSGCLQYLTALSGQITTFNYMASAVTTHLQNQRYNVCIRQAAGFCCVQYTTCDDNSFAIDNPVAGSAGKSAVENECTNDFVTLQGSANICASMAGGTSLTDRFCGRKLSAITMSAINVAVCDCTAPFEVGFTTNAAIDAVAPAATADARGVCLNYRQIPC